MATRLLCLLPVTLQVTCHLCSREVRALWPQVAGECPRMKQGKWGGDGIKSVASCMDGGLDLRHSPS